MNLPTLRLKGSILDIFSASLILLIVGISLAISFYLVTQITNTNNTIFGTTFIQVGVALNILATGGIIVWVVINLGAIASAYFIRSVPILAIVSFMILGIELLLSNAVVAIFQNFITQPQFIAIGNNQLSLFVIVFKMLPITVLAFGILLIIFQYSKPPVQRSV